MIAEDKKAITKRIAGWNSRSVFIYQTPTIISIKR